MGTKTKTRITIRTRQISVAQPLRVHCQQCGAEVPIITSADAAGALQTTPREVLGLLESGELHHVGDTADETLVCANSLTTASGEDETEGSEK